MPYTVSLTPDAACEPDAITVLAEADANISDLKWRGVAGCDQIAAANIHSSISSNVIEAVMVTDADAPDATGAVTALVANDIDLTAVADSTIAAGMAADADAVTCTFGDAAFGNWIKAAIAAGGTVTMKVESEVITVGAADGTAATALGRGAEGTTPATHADTTACALYVGTTCTTIPLTDPAVWGTPDRLVLICGTEQMLASVSTIDGTNDFVICTRGYDSTTAALHADAAAVTQYVDESTTQFDVDAATTILVGNHIKILTGGTEEMKVTAVATNRITVTRGYASTTPAVIATAQAIWKIYGDDVVATELALSDIPLEQRGDSISSMT